MDNGLCCVSDKICGNYCCRDDEYCDDSGLTKFCKTICPEGSSVVGTGDKAGDTSCSCETATPAWNGTACVACPTGSSLTGTGAETGVGSCKCDDSSYTWNASEGLCKAESNCMQKDDGSILCCDNGEKPYKFDVYASSNGELAAELGNYYVYDCCVNDPTEAWGVVHSSGVGEAPVCCKADKPILGIQCSEEGWQTTYRCYASEPKVVSKGLCYADGTGCQTYHYSDQDCQAIESDDTDSFGEKGWSWLCDGYNVNC